MSTSDRAKWKAAEVWFLQTAELSDERMKMLNHAIDEVPFERRAMAYISSQNYEELAVELGISRHNLPAIGFGPVQFLYVDALRQAGLIN